MKPTRIFFACFVIFMVYFGPIHGGETQLGLNSDTSSLLEKPFLPNDDNGDDDYLDYSELEQSETTLKPEGGATEIRKAGLYMI